MLVLDSIFFLGFKVCDAILIRNQYTIHGYQEVISPNIFNLKLWKTAIIIEYNQFGPLSKNIFTDYKTI